MIILKKTIFILVMGFTLASCSHETIRVSETISTREYDFRDISALEVATDFKAYVTFSETEERVQIQANDNLFERINVRQQGGKLTVKLDNNISLRGKEVLNLFITTRSISDFKASSDASIFLDSSLEAENVSVVLSSDAYFQGDITSDDFRLEASSDSEALLYLTAIEGDMDISSGAKIEGELQFDLGSLRLSSDSTMDFMGTIRELDARLSSDSRLRDYGLEVEDLKISLTSDSDAYLTVSNTIDVTANSDARLFYKGDAEVIRQVLSSDGQIIKK